MRLYQILESEYDDLEDADRFGDPEELRAILRVQHFISRRKPGQGAWHQLKPILDKIFNRQTIDRVKHEIEWSGYSWHYPYESGITHEDLELAYNLIRQYPDLQEWWEEFSEMPERLHPNYGRDPSHLDHLRLAESEYDDLEDADKFGGDVEFLGRATLGPHIFEVWYHKKEDHLSMDVNGYAFSPWDDCHMPIEQMEDIVRKAIQLRPDIMSQVRSQSPSGRILDIGLALVDQPNPDVEIHGML